MKYPILYAIPAIILMMAINGCHDRIPADPAITNPLEPCPGTPNCIRESYRIPSGDLDKLHELSLSIIRNDFGTEILHQQKDSIHATYKIFLFGYIDDLRIQFEKIGNDEILLHIRSSSREGTWDIGVNRRRVNRFIRKLTNHFR